MKTRIFISTVLFSVLLCLSCGDESLFTPLETTHTHIDFSNDINEDAQHNILNFMNMYTGAGVAVGDINNDGLPDLFFGGNMVSDALYINKGNLEFEDVTKTAGLINDRWSTGATMVDINQDGWMDIYVCTSGSDTIYKRANRLYINQHDNTFKEMATSYGLADTIQATQASFFDYDGDGDLDMFMIVNPVDYSMSNVNVVKSRKLNGSAKSTDKLYRNNGDNTFTDVSAKAGILIEGYSLGLGVSDINNDGLPDVYVSNDFLTNDIMYINNGDGTFTDKSHEWLKHTSFAGMGNDLADINNDGLTDILVLDMLPEDNKRQKKIIPNASYDKLQMTLNKGYLEQYTRNTLQLNNGSGSFSEISYLAGLSSTDWSWSVLLADYDNDGYRDAFITNGFRRDLGDLDYINYQQSNAQFFGTTEAKKKKKLMAIEELPSAPVHNYFFKNNGDLTFKDSSKEWGSKSPSISSGAVYADLDNDGDLDLIINNTNEKASLLRNNSNGKNKNHFLKLRLLGQEANRNGVGATIRISSGRQLQYYQHYLSRGYASGMNGLIHFGLGSSHLVDSLDIRWPDGKHQLLKNLPADTTLILNYKNAATGDTLAQKHQITPVLKTQDLKSAYFREVASDLGINFTHKENAFNDFKVQSLLPSMHSKLGPKMAVGDVNQDGLDDFYVGGASEQSGVIFIQDKDGHFQKKPLNIDVEREDLGAVFFDADGDQDLDLYVVSGGTSFDENSENYEDRLYINNGKGNFVKKADALPSTLTSGAVVQAADYDGDGDQDLFVGGRIRPGNYPLPPQSYILQNNNGTLKDVAADLNPELQNLGMVTAALWTDFNKDGKPDLMVTGEFMQLRLFENLGGKFKEVTKSVGLEHTHGWWNSLATGDFDNDGDMDYIAGNLGMNSKYKASIEEPLCIYAADFDKNGTIDPIMCYYIQGKNYPAPTRDAMIGQISAMRHRFNTYDAYANATFDMTFSHEELKNAYLAKSETFMSSYIENMGDGTFTIHSLPIKAQFAPINGLIPIDINGDGKLDLMGVGNNYSGDASMGNYDAMTGLCLLGDGKGDFVSLDESKTGFFVDTDAKDIKCIHTVNGKTLLLVSSNSSVLKAFENIKFIEKKSKINN